jgi:phage terminase small subunit
MTRRNQKATAKQKMFCLEYMIDLNATQAAIRSGYSVKTAASAGAENLTKSIIKEEISKLKIARSRKTKIDAEYVLRMSDELLKRCMAEGKEFNAAGAGKALDLIGKHISVQAYNEKSSIESTIKVKSFSEMYGDS